MVAVPEYHTAFHFLTFLHCSDTHRWLAQAGPRLPFALIRVVDLHGGQWGLLLIHAPKNHHLAPKRHGRGPRPCSGQWWQLAPCLVLHIQDLNAVQGHAGLTTAPQHVKQAIMVDGSAVDAALRHGGELLPVQGLDRTHRHLLHRHVSWTERRGRTITPHRGRRRGKRRSRRREEERVQGGGTQRWNKTQWEQEKQAEAQVVSVFLSDPVSTEG